MNSMRLKMGMLMVALAGCSLAELPTSTEKPAQTFARWESVPLRNESLVGKVIEIKESAASLHADPNGYVAVLIKYEIPYFSVIFDVPEEGLFNLYHHSESPGPIYILVTEKPFLEQNRRPGLFFRQSFELVALGDDYIKNEDKTVRYIWSDVEQPDFEKKEIWTANELAVFAEYLTIAEPVIKFRCFEVPAAEVMRDAEAEEIICSVYSYSGYRAEKMKVIIPEDEEDFIVTEDDRWGQVEFYAKVLKSENGTLMLRALGTHRKGKGDNAKYKW